MKGFKMTKEIVNEIRKNVDDSNTILSNGLDWNVDLENDEMITPYRASVILNSILSKFEMKEIPSQMIYNYTLSRMNHGKTPLIPCDSNGKIRFGDFKEWASRYIMKRFLNS